MASVNAPLLAAPMACLLAQILKPFLAWKDHGFHVKRFVGSGGMPSSHSSLVTALATCSGMVDGPGSTQFAIATVLAVVVMYDATGVRRQAGFHAMAINTILRKTGGVAHRSPSGSGLAGMSSGSGNENSVGGATAQTLLASSLQVDLEVGEYSTLHGEHMWPIPLNESIGHTPAQVATGGALGVVVGLVVGAVAS